MKKTLEITAVPQSFVEFLRDEARNKANTDKKYRGQISTNSNIDLSFKDACAKANQYFRGNREFVQQYGRYVALDRPNWLALNLEYSEAYLAEFGPITQAPVVRPESAFE